MRAGQPLSGLKIRLLLNEKVSYQWARSDANGLYSVSVPAGRYVVTGYEPDSEIANELLSGMIMYPEQHGAGQLSEPMPVMPGKPGVGLDFNYAAPVVLIEPVGVVAGNGKVVASWEEYPGAAAYRLPLEERQSERKFESTIFLPTESRPPQVTTNSVDLSTIGVKLKPGNFYILHIEALDKSGVPISKTADSYRRRGFVTSAAN